MSSEWSVVGRTNTNEQQKAPESPKPAASKKFVARGTAEKPAQNGPAAPPGPDKPSTPTSFRGSGFRQIFGTTTAGDPTSPSSFPSQHNRFGARPEGHEGGGFRQPPFSNRMYRPPGHDDRGEGDTREPHSGTSVFRSGGGRPRPTLHPLPEISTQHPLETPWIFTVYRRQAPKASATAYSEQIKTIGTATTVEEFWCYYSYLIRPGPPHDSAQNPTYCDIHVFRKGVTPIWEHERNIKGGKFSLRAAKTSKQLPKMWEGLLLALVGEQFTDSSQMCGAVASLRYKDDILSLWIGNIQEDDAQALTKKEIEEHLGTLPPSSAIEFTPHQEAIKQNTEQKAAVKEGEASG